MKIIAASENQKELLRNFLQPYEYACAGLAAIIRRFSEPVYIISNDTEVLESRQIAGIFSFKYSIFHCLPSPEILDQEFQSSFIEFFKGKKISSIIGKKSGTEFIYSLLQKTGFKTEQQVFYKLMTLSKIPLEAPEKLCNGDEIKRCQINNLEELEPLQKQYMEVEIAPVGRHITDLEANANLKQILKNQLCLALYTDGEPVAKINTNAIGFKWIQIGGVFTHPMYRHNYYAWQLLFVLCCRILKTQHLPCLFVKEKNDAAFSLYKKIGFCEKDSFAIFYMEKNS